MRALYIKPVFKVLDSKNFNSFEISGLRCGNPYFLNAGVATSASGLPRVFYLGRGSQIRLRSDLHWSTPHLKFAASTASGLRLLSSCLNRILTLWFLTSCRFWQLQSIFSVFAGFLGKYFDQQTCSIGEHSENQSSCSWVGGIRAVNGIRQGLIKYDAPGMPRVCHSHSGYGGGYGPLASHGKEDVTCKVSDPSFTNPTVRSDIEEKFMLIRWLFGGGDVHQRRITAHASWSGGIRMFFCISTSRNTIVLG